VAEGQTQFFERSEKKRRAERSASCDNQPRRGASSTTNGSTQPDLNEVKGSPKK